MKKLILSIVLVIQTLSPVFAADSLIEVDTKTAQPVAIPVRVQAYHDDGTATVELLSDSGTGPSYTISAAQILLSTEYAGLMGFAGEIGVVLGEISRYDDWTGDGVEGALLRLGVGTQGIRVGAGYGAHLGMIGVDGTANYIRSTQSDDQYVGVEGRVRVLILVLSAGMYFDVIHGGVVPTLGISLMLPIHPFRF